jgi:hypothetical protein
MRDLHGDAAQDFDPARPHAKRLVNIAGDQLRWLHEQLSPAKIDIAQDHHEL